MLKDTKKFIINKVNINEFNIFERFEQKLKEIVFGVLYILIKDEDSSFFQPVVLSIIEVLQLLAYSFHPLLYSSWGNTNESVISMIYTILIKTQVVNYLQGQSQILYLIIFYVGLLIIILLIANIVYVSASFSKSFFSSTWPLYVLRKGLKILLSVLFFPLLNLFISIFNCVNNGTIMYNYYVTDMVCFSGFHFLHLFLGVLASILLISITFTTALLYFELNDKLDDKMAKINSKCEVFQIFTKISLVFIFTFIPNYQNGVIISSPVSVWIVILILNILSCTQFFNFYLIEPYFNRITQNFFNIINGIYMWTNFVLLISNILQNINFSNQSTANQFGGSIYILLSGIPLIILILTFSKNSDDYIEVLSQNINKFQKGEEIERQMRYFLRLILRKGKDRKSEILLKGFVRNHENNCAIGDCPLKIVKRLLDGNGVLVGNQKNNQADLFSKNVAIQQYLFNFVFKVYTVGLCKFPNCTSLRISFALFLYHYQKQKLKTKQELENAEKSNPPLDQQFIIYRYKKILSEDQDTYTNILNPDSMDIQSQVAYDSHFRQCQNNIINSARMFLDFWSLLSTPNTTPDLYKLNELGLKIHELLKNINSHWNRMQHYKQNDPKALKMYASFCTEILNNREKGKEVLSMMKGNIFDKKQNSNQEFELENDEELAQGQAVFFCAAEQEGFGTIMKTTANASKIFGYLLEDICGKPIDDLFIDSYNGYVSSFLKDLIGSWTENNINENREQEEYLFFGKTKYLRTLPIYIKVIDPSKSVNEKMHFKCLFRTEQSTDELKDYVRNCFIVFNSNLNIQIYSDTLLELLYLIYGKNNNEINNLINLFPELLREGSPRIDKYEKYPHQHNFFKVTDTILTDLLNSDQTSYLEISLKIKNRGWSGQNNPSENDNDEDKPLIVKIKITTVQDLSYLKNIYDKDNSFFNKTNAEGNTIINNNDLSQRDISNEETTNLLGKEREKTDKGIQNDYPREMAPNKDFSGTLTTSNNYNFTRTNAKFNSDKSSKSIKSLSKEAPVDSAIINNYENLKDKTFCIKIEYSIIDKISDKVIGIEEEKLLNANDGLSIVKKFSLDSVHSPRLNVTFEKIITTLEYRNDLTNNLMAYIKDKGKFSYLFQWEGLDNNRLNKGKTSSPQRKSLNSPEKEIEKLNSPSFGLKKSFSSNVGYIGPGQLTNNLNIINMITPIEKSPHPNNDIINLNNYNPLSSLKEISLTPDNLKLLNDHTKEGDHNKGEESPKKLDKNSTVTEENSSSVQEEEEEDEDEEYTEEELEELEPSETYEDPAEIIVQNPEISILKRKIIDMKNYGKHIRTFILKAENEFREDTPTPQIKECLKTEEEYLRLLNEVEKQQEKEKNKLNNLVKNQKEEVANQPPKSLGKLSISSLVTLLTILVYAILDFIFNDRNITLMQLNFDMINYSYQAIDEIVWSSYLVRNLILATDPKYSNYLNEKDVDSFNNLTVSLLTNSFENLEYIINNITQSNLNLQPEHDILFKNESVPEFYYDENTGKMVPEYRTILAALADIRIYILTIASYPQSAILNNTLVTNLQYNSFNDFLFYLQLSAAYFADLVTVNSNYYKNIFLIFFLIIILLSFFFVYRIYKHLRKVDEDRTKILGAFYEIPSNYIAKLTERCLKFIDKNEKPRNEEEENESNGNFGNEEEDFETNSNIR